MAWRPCGINAVLAAAISLTVSTVCAQERITLPSLDMARGVLVELPGFWFPVVATRAPAGVLPDVDANRIGLTRGRTAPARCSLR